MAEKIGNKRWFIMTLFFICYTVLYMDRACISMTGPEIMKHFNWDERIYGLVHTAFFLGYAGSMIIGGALADKFGGGKVVCFGALWWSVFVFITPWAANLGVMIAIRALMGLGEGVSLPAMTSMIAKWVPKKEAGIAQGISLIGVAAGLALTMPLARWIMVTWGWEMVFHVFAFLAPVWVLLWKFLGHDRPEKDPKLSPAELAYIKAKPAEDVSAGNDWDDKITSSDIFSVRSVWVGACSFFCTNFLFYLFMTWLPTYFREGRGLDLSGSAYASMMPYVVAMFTYPIGGWLADKMSIKFGHNVGRKIFPWVGQLAAGVLLVCATQAQDMPTAVALISASNGFLCLTMGGYYSMPIVFSQKNAGKIVGLWATFATVGGITAPTITGFLVKGYGYNTALIFGACVAIVGAVLLCFVRIQSIQPKSVREAAATA